jgi:hypothetical protein
MANVSPRETAVDLIAFSPVDGRLLTAVRCGEADIELPWLPLAPR